MGVSVYKAFSFFRDNCSMSRQLAGVIVTPFIKVTAFFKGLSRDTFEVKADITSDYTRTTKACLGKQNNVGHIPSSKV